MLQTLPASAARRSRHPIVTALSAAIHISLIALAVRWSGVDAAVLPAPKPAESSIVWVRPPAPTRPTDAPPSPRGAPPSTATRSRAAP